MTLHPTSVAFLAAICIYTTAPNALASNSASITREGGVIEGHLLDLSTSKHTFTLNYGGHDGVISDEMASFFRPEQTLQNYLNPPPLTIKKLGIAKVYKIFPTYSIWSFQASDLNEKELTFLKVGGPILFILHHNRAYTNEDNDSEDDEDELYSHITTVQKKVVLSPETKFALSETHDGEGHPQPKEIVKFNEDTYTSIPLSFKESISELENKPLPLVGLSKWEENGIWQFEKGARYKSEEEDSKDSKESKNSKNSKGLLSTKDSTNKDSTKVSNFRKKYSQGLQEKVIIAPSDPVAAQHEEESKRIKAKIDNYQEISPDPVLNKMNLLNL